MSAPPGTSTRRRAAAVGRRQLAFVQHSGWANQLVALAHALHLARRTNRSLVIPRALRLGDVLDDGGCAGHPPPTLELLRRYEPFLHTRLPLSAFVDTDAWPVPADNEPANAMSRHLVENKCANASEVEGSVVRDIQAVGSIPLVQLGSAFTLYPEPSCDFCYVKYKSAHRRRATRLLCSTKYASLLCNKTKVVKYDAIHLRLQQPYSDLYNVNATLQRALAAADRRPLYVASDVLGEALALARALDPGRRRRVLSLRDFNPAALDAFFGRDTATSSAFAYARPILVDAMLCVQAHVFTGSLGTFSGHILGMRACKLKHWRPAHCPSKLLPYDFSANCHTAWACRLPRDAERRPQRRAGHGLRP